MDFKNGEFFKCCAVEENLPKPGFYEVVFVGRSNVGKSSIINCLFCRKNLAKISSRPGKTSTVNFYKAGRGFLVDLPGYGFSKVVKSDKKRWSFLIDAYFNGMRTIKLVVVVLDCRHGFLTLDLAMVNFLIKKNLSFVIVLNKVDKLSNKQLDEKLNYFKHNFTNFNFFKFSTKTKCGVNELKKIISCYVNE